MGEINIKKRKTKQLEDYIAWQTDEAIRDFEENENNPAR